MKLLGKILPTGLMMLYLSRNITSRNSTLVFRGYIEDIKIPVNVFDFGDWTWICHSQVVVLEMHKAKLERALEDIEVELSKYKGGLRE